MTDRPGRRLSRTAALAVRIVAALLVFVTAMSGNPPVWAQSGQSASKEADDTTSYRAKTLEFYNAGDYAQAEEYALKYADAVREQYGENDVTYATALNNIGLVYYGQGRYPEAEEKFRASLALNETISGPATATVALNLANLALVLDVQGKLSEAVDIHKRSLEIREQILPPDHTDLAYGLNNYAENLRFGGHPKEAEPHYLRAAAIFEKTYGEKNNLSATIYNNLGYLYDDLGRYDDAETYFRKALVIREEVLQPQHPDLGVTVLGLGTLLRGRGRYAEAEPLLLRSLEILKASLGERHPRIAMNLNFLGELYWLQNRFQETEDRLKQAIEIMEATLGPEHPRLAESIGNLGLLYDDLGRYAEAVPLVEKALALMEKSMGSGHPAVATNLNNLASIYSDLGDDAKAERYYKQSLDILLASVGPEHSRTATGYNNLAILYSNQGRYADALQLHERSLAVRIKVLGERHPDVALSLNNIADIHRYRRQYAKAEELYNRALDIRRETLGPDHASVAASLSSLGDLYNVQRRYGDAQPLYRQAMAIKEKVLGGMHLDVADEINSLAVSLQHEGRYDEAEPLHRRALAIREAALGPDHKSVAYSLKNLAVNRYLQKRWSDALPYYRKATEILISTDRKSAARLGDTLATAQSQEVEDASWIFASLVRVIHQLREDEQTRPAGESNEAYIAAQRSQGSRAANALAQMAVRFNTGDAGLAEAVRERQDLVSQFQATDKLLIAAVSKPADRRDAAVIASLQKRLSEIDGRVGEIDVTLKRDFPDYSQLSSPEPIDLEATQKLLEDDEALLLYLDISASGALPEESLLWVITAERASWLRLAAGPRTNARSIHRMRKILTGVQVFDVRGAALDQKIQDALTRAHDLYGTLLAPAAGLIEGKQLLIVPSASLTSMPWHILLRAAPDFSGTPADTFAGAAWLALDHAVTVLPSVASLKALREDAKVSAAAKPYFGIGNPLLKGPSGRDERAARYKTCGDWDGTIQVASRGGEDAVSDLFRGSTADVSKVSRLKPLPETTGELCSVARSFAAQPDSIVLGAAATETALKEKNALSDLSAYRVLHFATHGLVTGELNGLSEPALVLTPPDEPSEADDGLLTASEVAQLQLDADWVVLSACNTAAGETGSAEALSGLARAFFYAGARALLVSHWPVSSKAAVDLTTGTFQALEADPKLGRAEALRRTMVSLIRSGDLQSSLPGYWAPFVVVGEGRSTGAATPPR